VKRRGAIAILDKSWATAAESKATALNVLETLVQQLALLELDSILAPQSFEQ
jgi:hypothetical protein